MSFSGASWVTAVGLVVGSSDDGAVNGDEVLVIRRSRAAASGFEAAAGLEWLLVVV